MAGIILYGGEGKDRCGERDREKRTTPCCCCCCCGCCCCWARLGHLLLPSLLSLLVISAPAAVAGICDQCCRWGVGRWPRLSGFLLLLLLRRRPFAPLLCLLLRRRTRTTSNSTNRRRFPGPLLCRYPSLHRHPRRLRPGPLIGGGCGGGGGGGGNSSVMSHWGGTEDTRAFPTRGLLTLPRIPEILDLCGSKPAIGRRTRASSRSGRVAGYRVVHC